MSPNSAYTHIDDVKTDDVFEKLTPPQAGMWKKTIAFEVVLLLTWAHISAFYGIYLCFTSAKWQTMLFGFCLAYLGDIGMSAGAHRLWSHKAYKAKLPLQILLMLLQSLTSQRTVINWVKLHRLHHKYSDTDADPHNAARGLFFSHIGWILVRENPEVIKRGKLVDLSDVRNNPVLRFQRKYAIPVIGTICFILPTLLPIYCWEENLNNAWHITILRVIYTLHVTFLINSLSHKWGKKPYDKTIKPSNNFIVSLFTIGDGYHNYHHSFPWDYNSAELGNDAWNISTKFIDFFAWLGWAYDLKTAAPEIVERRAERTGDGSQYGMIDMFHGSSCLD